MQFHPKGLIVFVAFVAILALALNEFVFVAVAIAAAVAVEGLMWGGALRVLHAKRWRS